VIANLSPGWRDAVQWMQRPHVAYVGADDAMREGRPRRWPGAGQLPLTIVETDGDHFTSLAPSVKAFIERLKADA